MGLIQKKNYDFTSKKEDHRKILDNSLLIKGGSTIVNGFWVKVPNIRIDVKKIVSDFLGKSSRRIFNHFNDILYVLIAVDKNSKLEVIPSISFNKKSFGEIKTFPDLSGKVPLVLVRLRQDGSEDLKAIKEIRKEDIEEYKGYGNLTLMGPDGEPGDTGIRGIPGITGIQGPTGVQGQKGYDGVQGITGMSAQGATGPIGDHGLPIPTLLIERSLRVDFDAEPRFGSEPLIVQFTDRTSGLISEWYWDFGDGHTSTEQNPEHTYLYDGSYTVSLRVSTGLLESTEVKVGYITVTDVYFIQDTTDPNEINWQDTVDDEEINIQDSTEL